ncbi:MAG: 16S rRNA (guanine(527)-N(7))-methyltransferase RsmG [Candidatus Dormibacteria bacterium]
MHADRDSPLLEQYCRELLRWNRSMNLTALSEEHLRHVLIEDTWRMGEASRIAKEETVMDIGAGGGVVGIPLAIWHPEASFVLVDSIRKKTSFLLYTVGILGLRNVAVVTTRLEARAFQEEWRGKVDCVCSRAALSHDTLIPLAAPLLAPGGRIVLWLHSGREVASRWNAGTSSFHASAVGSSIVRLAPTHGR